MKTIIQEMEAFLKTSLNSLFIFMSLIVVISVVFLWSGLAFAVHPLITDDAGTQGKGGIQLEFNGEYNYDKETKNGATTKETGSEAAIILTYGLTDNVDIVFGLPYQWKKAKENGAVTFDVDGISDMSLEVKWRFYEKDNLNFSLKPGITLPTGNENKGLGNGRASYGLVLISTKETGRWSFHLNLAYTHNKYKLKEDNDANRKGIWHASLASEVEVVKDLKLVANIGMEKNPDRTSNTHPAFILGGIICPVSENFDINFGVKSGLNKPETDFTILIGSVLKF